MKGRWGSRLERLPLLARRRAVAYAIATALSLFAWWARLELDPLFPPGFPYLTFFPAVILTSFLFGRGPGTLAALLCGVLAWYSFIPPFNTFTLGRNTAVALLFYAGVVAVDIALIHWMQGANAQARDERERSRHLAAESAALADRNALLFHELQHRVSNNIQMAGAVLSLQKRGVDDPAARKALDDAVAKLQLIGRIQRQLYDLGGASAAPEALLRQLADDLLAASGKPGVTCQVAVRPGLTLDPDAMIPLALIMAEAFANAVEHGFATRDTGLIRIALDGNADELALEVEDDGVGLPPGFDGAAATSLGLKIAHTLARQLGGTLHIVPRPGGGTLTQLTVAPA